MSVETSEEPGHHPQPSAIRCSPEPAEVLPEDASRKSGPLSRSDEVTPPLQPHGISGEL